MKKIIINCQKCGENIFFNKIEHDNISVHCVKCGNDFIVKNLIDNALKNSPEVFSSVSGIWFYKYSNSDVNMGIMFRKFTWAVIFSLGLLFCLGFFIFYLKVFAPHFHDENILFKILPYGFMVFSILLIMFYFFWSMFGKLEIHIGNESYIFYGIPKLGKKRYFNWSEIKNIALTESDMGFRLGIIGNNKKIIFYGKNSWDKPMEISCNWISNDEAKIFIALLLYLSEEKHKDLDGGI